MKKKETQITLKEDDGHEKSLEDVKSFSSDWFRKRKREKRRKISSSSLGMKEFGQNDDNDEKHNEHELSELNKTINQIKWLKPRASK